MERNDKKSAASITAVPDASDDEEADDHKMSRKEIDEIEDDEVRMSLSHYMKMNKGNTLSVVSAELKKHVT